MKKAFTLVPLLFALLLSACGNAALQRYESFSQQLLEQDTLSFTALPHVRAAASGGGPAPWPWGRLLDGKWHGRGGAAV